MILHFKAKPGSRKNELMLGKDKSIKVKVAAPPVEGKANDAIILFLSDFFDLPKSRFKLLKGQTSAFKTVEIDADENLIWEMIFEKAEKA